LSKNNTKPSRRKPQVRQSQNDPAKPTNLSGAKNLPGHPPSVNTLHQRREGASMPLAGTGQPPFRQERYHSANLGTPRSIGVCGS
jgi:hypothetical protein